MHETQLNQSDHENQLLTIWDLYLMPDDREVQLCIFQIYLFFYFQKF